LYKKGKWTIKLGLFCLTESGFLKTTFQTFLCLFIIRKVGQRKTLSSQRKIWLGFQKSVFPLFWRKTLSGSCEKFRNVILFADYIKFGSQTFDCYIYFVLNIFFQFYPLEFDFYINFGPHFYNCYLFFPYHFLIEIFYLSNLVLILLLLLIVFEIIYEMVIIIIILISSSFNFFYLLYLISIILIIIYFIWDNLWHYFFFQFHSYSTF
jgi:hypothetical protein